jgi:phage terminase large subunit-like protein
LLATLRVKQWSLLQARHDQRAPEGLWRTWYLSGGRGSGKTRSGAGTLADWIVSDPEPGEWGIVAPTIQDARDTCMEGPSGLLAALGTSRVEIADRKSVLCRAYNRNTGELIMRSGHIVRFASADDGALRIQGKNLKGLWADEIGLWDRWETAWDESIRYAVRMGRSQIIATGTPKIARKARVLVKRLLEDPDVPVSRLRTVDNLANLSAAFRRDVIDKAVGTRLERQELEGELLEDVEGALWTFTLIDAGRITWDAVPDMARIVIGFDPAVTSGEGSDETGIVVVGEANREGYVLADYSLKANPDVCMRKAVEAYREHKADCIVIEANNGGDYLPSLLHTIDPNVPVRKVNATRGKELRAQPSASLYEQHRIHHVGAWPDLEQQMCSWVPGDKTSPDRLDALVWGLTELRGIRAGSYKDAYSAVTCGGCKRLFRLDLHPDVCPFCGTPAENAE